MSEKSAFQILKDSRRSCSCWLYLGTSGRHRKQSKLLQCNDYRCRAKGYAAGCLIVEEQVGFDRF